MLGHASVRAQLSFLDIAFSTFVVMATLLSGLSAISLYFTYATRQNGHAPNCRRLLSCLRFSFIFMQRREIVSFLARVQMMDISRHRGVIFINGRAARTPCRAGALIFYVMKRATSKTMSAMPPAGHHRMLTARTRMASIGFSPRASAYSDASRDGGRR